MDKWLLVAVVIGFALGPTLSAHAGADIKAGEAKAQVCAACHGADGNSTTPMNPKLAGQVPGYNAAQLANFRSGARENAMMLGMAQPLSEDDMQNLDAYFASQTMTPGAVREDQLEMAKAGERVYRGGYRPLQVPACMGCHGPAGKGIPTQFPRVAGQYAQYLEAQLLAFKSGVRANEIMGPIAFRLSEQQIKELALYMQALH